MGPRGDPGRRRGVGGRGPAPLNRTVLVTGGAGFIGASLVRELADRGDRVRVLDDLSVGNRAYLDGVPHELTLASLAEPSAVARAVDGVDAVIHLAARPGVPDSVTNPAATFEANVVQTVGLLEAVRVAGVPRFVFASSNAAVGLHEPPTNETSLPRPASPYGASKLAGESFCAAYAETFGLPTCSLRFSNAYGPFAAHKRSVIATWLRAALAGDPVTIHGDGEQTRDFIHVDDLVAAIAAAVDAPAPAVAGEVFQVGTGREVALNELAAAIGRAVGRRLDVRYEPARPGDVRRNVAKVDKAARELGFRATVDLEDGLARTLTSGDWAVPSPAPASIGPSSRPEPE